MSTTEIAPVTTPPSADKSKRRKAKAILAGGLVLGIGAAVTLAAWNDSEFVFGEFGTGTFNVQGSADGVDFDDHASGAPAGLSFTTTVTNMSPNQTVAAPYALRIEQGSTYAASVTVGTASGTGGAAAQLTYGIFRVDSKSDCTPGAEATQATEIVPAETTFAATPSAVAGANNFTLAAPADGSEGTPTFVCIQVTAGPGLPQGETAEATWEFVATSAQ
jgi:predicted ribosomally synthesized peptide with SipW-like signal peptide